MIGYLGIAGRQWSIDSVVVEDDGWIAFSVWIAPHEEELRGPVTLYSVHDVVVFIGSQTLIIPIMRTPLRERLTYRLRAVAEDIPSERRSGLGWLEFSECQPIGER